MFKNCHYTLGHCVSNTPIIHKTFVPIGNGSFEIGCEEVPYTSDGIPSPEIYSLDNLLESGISLHEVPLTPIISNTDALDKIVEKIENL